MAIQTYIISFADRIYLSLSALQIVLLSFANPCSYLVTSMDFLKDEQICCITHNIIKIWFMETDCLRKENMLCNNYTITAKHLQFLFYPELIPQCCKQKCHANTLTLAFPAIYCTYRLPHSGRKEKKHWKHLSICT